LNLFNMAAQSGGVVHFVGIGGIGMSGLAEALVKLGFKVSGSDIFENNNVIRLKGLGVQVSVGHKASNVEGADLVVYSTAIKQDNCEMVAARQADIKIVHRADVLAEVMKNYKTIAIAGTHGKTSTTGLMWTALKETGIDVGLINGGVMQEIGTNICLPKTKDGWACC